MDTKKENMFYKQFLGAIIFLIIIVAVVLIIFLTRKYDETFRDINIEKVGMTQTIENEKHIYHGCESFAMKIALELDKKRPGSSAQMQNSYDIVYTACLEKFIETRR